MIYLRFILTFLLLAILSSCEQGEPPVLDIGAGRDGDTLTFSGREWWIKGSDFPVGPGPNRFSKREQDVYLDSNGFLHLKISEFDGHWWSTEVVSIENMGYGTYIFTIDGDLRNIPNNIVLGLFCWDDNTFQKQANSEVDIEFSKWGSTTQEQTLLYTVQPMNFAGATPERQLVPNIDPNLNIGVTTHGFTWTDTLISWASYVGSEYGSGTPYASFEYSSNNPGRVKVEGGKTSDPIVIPAPGATTNARINLWITPWVNPAPTDGKEQEIIIRSFEYTPL